MKIVLTGSTGFIGGDVLDQCLRNSSITSIVVLSRRELPSSITDASPKLKVVLMKDFTSYPEDVVREIRGAEACIWALGKALAKTDEEARVISMDYTLAAVKAFNQSCTPQNGKKFRFIYLSGRIAERDQEKPLWYMQKHRRIRGQLENELIKFADDHQDVFETYITRPSMVLSKNAAMTSLVFSYLIQTVKVDVLSGAMTKLAINGNAQQTFSNEAINNYMISIMLLNRQRSLTGKQDSPPGTERLNSVTAVEVIACRQEAVQVGWIMVVSPYSFSSSNILMPRHRAKKMTVDTQACATRLHFSDRPPDYGDKCIWRIQRSRLLQLSLTTSLAPLGEWRWIRDCVALALAWTSLPPLRYLLWKLRSPTITQPALAEADGAIYNDGHFSTAFTFLPDSTARMKSTLLTATTLLLSASSVIAHGEPNLKHEHAGELFQKFHGGHWYGEGVINNGTPAGQTVQLGGESIYLSYPRRNQTEYAVLYLTDIFGNALVNNKLLADSIARAGYFVAMPDLFRGDPVPADALSNPNSGFNMTAWRARHPQSQVEEIIQHAISTVRADFNTSKLGAVGYCFGGKYVARFLAQGRGLDAGFTAHPSAVTADEWTQVNGPISIAFGDLDTSNTPDNRTNIESIFFQGNKTYQTSLYANAEHGFAVRTNLTDKKKAFAQESAYFQAVRWFDAWL